MTQPTAEIENFDIETELQCRCGCKSYNYDNEFLIRLQAYRYMLNQGMTVTSGCRCKQHNKDEGGVDTSLHICEGKAAMMLDFTCNDMQSAYNLACTSGLFNEVIWYKSKNFIHIGLDRNQTEDYFITK